MRPDAERKIIHIDMDCYYAAVEARENPKLKNKPIAVGGNPGQRGVVATCSYEARKYGIHSAMPMAQAIKKCPKLIIMKPNMSLYQSISKDIHKIFKHYTKHIQPLSLDEAFLDVSTCSIAHGSATLIAKIIRQEIYDKHQLTASAGIAPNKFLAKIASDWNKPNGQFVITPQQVASFVKKLPVNKIYGVGKVTTQKMYDLKIKTCADLQKISLLQLMKHFGKFGNHLYQLSRGQDARPVESFRIRKSLSIEDTYANDLANPDHCLEEIKKLYIQLKKRLKNANNRQKLEIKNCYVKLRFNNFSVTTAQQKTNQPKINDFIALFNTAWHRYKRPVRLIGLGVQFKPPSLIQQTELNLF